MLRSKNHRAVFLFLPFVFCLYFIGISVANDPCFQGFSTIPGNVKYIFEWDPENPQEISRNSNVEIKVIGGIPQYNWSVSGTGFGLAQSQSNDVSNTLTADSTACGTATITVTDGRGDKITGYVRCTSGHWVLFCESIMPDDNCHRGGGNTYYYEGNRRIYILVRCIWDWPAPRKCWFHSCGGYDSKNYIPEDAVCWAIYDPYDCTHYLGGPGYACPGDDVGHSCCTLNLGIQVHEWVCQ